MGAVIQARPNGSEVPDGKGGGRAVAGWPSLLRGKPLSSLSDVLSQCIGSHCPTSHLWLIRLWAFYSTNTMYDWKVKRGSWRGTPTLFSNPSSQWNFTKTSTIRSEKHKKSRATWLRHYLERTQDSCYKNYSLYDTASTHNNRLTIPKHTTAYYSCSLFHYHEILHWLTSTTWTPPYYMFHCFLNCHLDSWVTKIHHFPPKNT